MQPHPGAPQAGERWNVNMPAVIGVVFVFLVGVIVWVILSSGDDDDTNGAPSPPVAQATATTQSPAAAAGSTTLETTPTPLPVTVPTTAAPPSSVATSDPSATSVPPSTTPVTAAPGAGDDAVPGDLAIAGHPMQQPECTGGYITVLASAVGAQATAGGLAGVLDSYPGSNYLRTDQTCSSLTQNIDGDPIYVVFFGPFPFASDACAARADGSPDAYARQLSNDVGSGHSVGCA